MTIGPADSRAVAAAVLAFRAADRGLRRVVNQDTATEFRPAWTTGVRSAAAAGPGAAQRTPLLAAGVTFSPGNPPRGRAYTARRALSGGLGTDSWWAVEFGARRTDPVRVRRRTAGGSVTYTARTKRGLPPRRKAGYAVFPTVEQLAPRVVSFWVAAVVRAYRLAAEGTH